MTNILALDLEMNQPSNKIIQVGITIGNIENKEVLYKGGWYLSPDEPISEYIQNLTRINDEIIQKHAVSKEQMFEELFGLHKNYNCFISPVVWGQGDMPTLRQLYGNGSGWCFGFREWDFKTMYQLHMLKNGKSTKGSLSGALKACKMKFIGNQHNAVDDSYNTFLLACYLFEKVG